MKDVVLTEKQWNEISSVSMVLDLVLNRCEDGDVEHVLEAVRAAHLRLDRAIVSVNRSEQS